jgi:flagellar biosynthesis anti-sigma factor FlgM
MTSGIVCDWAEKWLWRQQPHSSSQAGKDYQVAKQAVSDASDVRMDLVNDIKARLANGTYNVSDEELADKLLERYCG